MPNRDEQRPADDRPDTSEPADSLPDPADTTHPTGDKQATENAANEPPG
jgi:hypothetical protein